MKKFLTFSLAFGLSISSFAIPAKRGTTVVKNSDGTTMEISLCGDETFHYYVNVADGQPVRQNEEGNWVADTRDVTTLWKQASAKRNVHRQRLAEKTRRIMRAPRRADEASNKKKGLLILVEFTDKTFSNSDAKTKEIYEQKLNGINNPYGKEYGSVREYFREQSYGQFDIEFDVVGPVTLSHDMKYYGEDNGGEGEDIRPGQMVKEALTLVKDQVNFADYDWDGDKEVENIYITYAGYGQAVSGADPNTIWPHQWRLSEATNSVYRYNGITIDTYACGSELMGITGKAIDGNGTMCHEYSHCLGLPDFYNTGSSTQIFGMSEWSVLDYGCYNGDGFCPAAYTAYERWFAGWLEPTELAEPCTVTGMSDICEKPEAYVIYNDKKNNGIRGEYYLLFNVQKTGWNKYAVGHGMMVLHVDYDENAWYNNTVNNVKSQQRMTIIPADGVLKLVSGYGTADAGDLWPGTSKKTELTDESTPAATIYNKNTDGTKLMHKPITEITETNKEISFNFMGGAAAVEAPAATEASAIAANGFTANWDAVEGAASYDLILNESYDDGQEEEVNPVLKALAMYEDFWNFYVEDTATSDGTKNLKEELDDLTFVSGWTGDYVYKGLIGAKLGSSTKAGYLTTPVIESTTGETTLYLDAYDWFNYSTLVNTGQYKADGSTLDVSILDADGNEVQKQNVKLPDYLELYEQQAYPEIVLHFSNVPGQYMIRVSTTAGKKRAWIKLFMTFDGNYTLEEILTVFDSQEEEGEEDLDWSLGAPRHKANAAKRHFARAPFRKQVTNSQTFTGLQGTSLVIEDLVPGATYTYRVRAYDAEGKASAWSNAVTLTLPADEDAISNVNAAMPTTAQGVFDLQGRRVNGILTRGIYIRDGRKFIVK